MSQPVIVILDFGSTSAKCLIFNLSGRKIAQVKRRWNFADHHPGDDLNPDFNTQQAWKILASCCRQALYESNLDSEDVLCVIPTSQRHGAVLLDKQGKSVFSFTNANTSSAAEWREISQQQGEFIYRKTGRWPQNVFLPAHLFWLREKKPGLYKKISAILGIQDWLVYRLSNQLTSEPTIAGDLLLMNVSSAEWSDSILKLFGIDADLLPPLVESGMEVGRVTQNAAEETGLKIGTPVLSGAADSQLAFLGVGVHQANQAVAVFGTTIPVMLLLDEADFHPHAVTWTNRHLIPGQWVLESNSGDSGLCLTNFRNLLLPGLVTDGDHLKFNDLPSLLELDKMAGGINGRIDSLLGSWGPIIFDGKKWPEVSGTLRGLNLLGRETAGIADLYMSLVENIGFAVKANLHQLSQTTDCHPSRISLGGPALESPVWQEVMAGILGLPVHIPEEKEVTPLGAAVLAAWKTGMFDSLSEAAENMVRVTEMDATRRKKTYYEEKFKKWRKVYEFSLV